MYMYSGYQKELGVGEEPNTTNKQSNKKTPQTHTKNPKQNLKQQNNQKQTGKKPNKTHKKNKQKNLTTLRSYR